jgi:hypothetical protein
MAQLKEGSVIKKSTGDEVIATVNDIPEIPTSLPANGGNADTVGGFTVGTNVPANAKFTDTVYTHPANHPASIITQDSNNRFVTDVEKNNWDGKADVSDIPTSLSQLINDSGFITINQVPQGIEVVQNTPTTTKSGQIIFLEVL